MKILVAIKRVVDFNVRVRVKADGSGVETDQVKMSINPFDEIAIEEALRLKEKGIAQEVVLVTVGAPTSQEVLRHGLAMGADRAILIETHDVIEPLHVAKLMHALAQQENPQLIILGKQAIDDDNNQTGQMLAGLLNWGQGTFASKLEINADQARVTREIDGGLETIEVKLPAIITTDLRLNTPRYITLPNIMKSKTKPITSLTPEKLGVKINSHMVTLGVNPPATRKAGVSVKSVEELLGKLINEVKVIT